MTIKLTDAAKYYKELSHQLAAWNWLQEQLTKEQLDEFADLYRSAVDPKPVYQNTWNGIRQAASDAGAKFPEVVAAQWALESGWGKHISGTHNYFGLKGKGGTVVDTQEYIDGQWVESGSGATLDVQNPATGDTFATVPACIYHNKLDHKDNCHNLSFV